jgi:hypothetical protein
MRRMLVWLAIAAALALPAPALGIAISNIQFDPAPVAAIQWNQTVNITFDYTVDVTGGARIFARPFTHGSLTPNYGASGSPLYPVGSGSGSANFRITSGETVVDEVRFQVYNADQTALLLEFFVPVYYLFGAHAIHDIVMAPASPSCVMFDQQRVDIAFDYRTSYPGDVLIFARPITNGALTPDYGASGSPFLPTGSGSGTQWFTISHAPEVTVDHIRFQMLDAAQTTVLLEFQVPCHFEFKAGSVYNITFQPDWPCAQPHDEWVDTYFEYQTNVAGGVRIFVLPYTGGAPTPGYAVSGSPLYPAGTGTGNPHFRIMSGEQTIDHVRYKMTNADQTQTLFEYFLPVNIHYAGSVVRRVQLAHPSPAYFTLNHHADMDLPYTTSEAGGVRIWPQPYTHGGFTPSGAFSGSPVWPVGSGVATGYVTVTAQAGVVDQIYLFMSDAGQTQALMEWCVDVQLHFGNQVTADVPMAGEIPAAIGLFTAVESPFTRGSTVRYELPGEADVRLGLFDVLGREVALLVREHQAAGGHTVAFDPGTLARGVYLLRLEAQLRDTGGALGDQRKVLVMR